MAAVVFAIGSRPHLALREALELAELLARRRTPAAVSAGGKIRVQAEIDQEASTELILDREELAEVVAVLQEPRWPVELPAFVHLRAEIAAELR